jgi:hypothetical protein
MHFVLSSKKTPIQISDMLEEAENMFKSIEHFKIHVYDIRDFWEVEILNQMIVDPGEGGLTAIIWSKLRKSNVNGFPIVKLAK